MKSGLQELIALSLLAVGRRGAPWLSTLLLRTPAGNGSRRTFGRPFPIQICFADVRGILHRHVIVSKAWPRRLVIRTAALIFNHLAPESQGQSDPPRPPKIFLLPRDRLS